MAVYGTLSGIITEIDPVESICGGKELVAVGGEAQGGARLVGVDPRGGLEAATVVGRPDQALNGRGGEGQA